MSTEEDRDIIPFHQIMWWCPECSEMWDKDSPGVCPGCGNECGNEKIGYNGNPDANENGDVVRCLTLYRRSREWELSER